jgi:hypothetical protein
MKFANLMLAFLAVAGGAAAQQPSMTISVTGLGCSTTAGSNVFPIVSWAFGVSDTITPPIHPPSFTYLNFGKNQDACTAKLQAAAASHQNFNSLTMTQYDPISGNKLMTIQLSNGVSVQEDHVSGTNESVAIAYGTIALTSYFLSTQQACWNLTTDSPC